MNCRCLLTSLALVLAEPGVVKAQSAQPASPPARCKEEEGLRLAEMAYLSEGQIPEEVGHGAVL